MAKHQGNVATDVLIELAKDYKSRGDESKSMSVRALREGRQGDYTRLAAKASAYLHCHRMLMDTIEGCAS